LLPPPRSVPTAPAPPIHGRRPGRSAYLAPRAVQLTALLNLQYALLAALRSAFLYIQRSVPASTPCLRRRRKGGHPRSDGGHARTRASRGLQSPPTRLHAPCG